MLRVNRDVSRENRLLDEAAIVRTYRETIRPLYAYVSRRVGGDRALAEDLVQETWMRALDAWPRGDVPGEPLAWLVRVAHNLLVSYFRRARPALIDPADLDLQAAACAPDRAEIASAVSWGLARLRPRHSELIEAFYFDGKTMREIAREHSLSERAVEGRLERARVKLRKALQPILRPSQPTGGRTSGEHEHVGHTRTS